MADPVKLVLVDDEQEFVDTMAERMEMRGYRCFVAYSGEAGLKLFEAEKPDVMVVDIGMPGMGGLEVMDQVRHSDWPIPVVVLSGHANTKEEDKSMRRGAIAYLHKPLSLDHLIETIQSALHRHPELRPGNDSGC